MILIHFICNRCENDFDVLLFNPKICQGRMVYNFTCIYCAKEFTLIIKD